MKTKGLHIRISERRLNKIRLYAQMKEKSVTQIIEDYIDRLQVPVTENGNSSIIPLPNQPNG